MVVAGSQRMGPMAMPGSMPLGPELPAPNSAMPPLFPRPNCTKHMHPQKTCLRREECTSTLSTLHCCSAHAKPAAKRQDGAPIMPAARSGDVVSVCHSNCTDQARVYCMTEGTTVRDFAGGMVEHSITVR